MTNKWPKIFILKTVDHFRNFYIYHGPSQINSPLGVGVETWVEENDCFVLQTCQRRIVISLFPLKCESTGIEIFHSQDAYRFLLEVVCGLHSKVLGESEVLAQFRQAFQNYLGSRNAQSELVKIFEKILKDAKEVRTRFLMGIGKNSYGGLTRRLLQGSEGTPVLVLGSGDLAYQVLTNLKKRHPILLSARNAEKMSPLLDKFGAQSADWKNYDHWMSCPLIVNTIGSDECLFQENFFDQWAPQHAWPHRRFIDLGAPSPISTPLSAAEGVVRLPELFAMVGDLSTETHNKINQARLHINQLAQKRERIFSIPQVPIGQDLRYL